VTTATPKGLGGSRRVAGVRVIGCGNPDSGDDAAGLLALRLARPELERILGIEVIEAGPGLRLLELLEGAQAVLVIDAVRAPRHDRRPGEIVRAEAGPNGLAAEVGSSVSSHGFGVADVIGLAGALGQVPRLVFIGVEVEDVTAGHPLSKAVADALPALARLVETEAALLAEAPP
jgi:hydrogenase maturation protease